MSASWALVRDWRRFDAGDRAAGPYPGARCRRGIGDAVGVEYVSRVPRPPLDGLIDDLYYLEGAPPYARLTLPPAPSALLILNLGCRFAFAPAPPSCNDLLETARRP